jgi:catechol 2,3-dioxygenase-like lactoylglutathione lyase family enzyme
MTVSGILHATLLVADLARSRAFYGELLGMQEAVRPDLGFPGIWYRLGDGRELHLMLLPNPEAGLTRPEHGGRDRHIAFAVGGLDGLAHRLGAASIAYTRSRSGRAALFCRDPDDNALEFIEVGA